MPSSIDDVARPANAIATSGSRPTALAYQRLVKPSASAALRLVDDAVGAGAAAGQSDAHGRQRTRRVAAAGRAG